MSAFNQRITRIKGLSEKRRLPRLGKIRLGIKVANNKGTTYPKEVPFFVVPDEVKKIYGEQPTEIDCMFPLDDIDTVFPVSYKYYGSGKGLKCNGDGEIAYCADEKTKEVIEKKCPCNLLDEGKCKQSGTLSVMLQKINVGGVYQITTSSYNSIIDIASGIDYVKALLGRVAMVPLKLRRVATETHHDEKKQTHYTIQIVMDANIDAINQLRADTMRVLEHTSRIVLPEPVHENPELDPVDIIVDDDIPAELGNEPDPKATMAAEKAADQPPENIVFVTLKDVTSKTGETNGRKWTLYTITTENGDSFGTFDTQVADLANSFISSGELARITWEVTKKGNKQIVELAA